MSIIQEALRRKDGATPPVATLAGSQPPAARPAPPAPGGAPVARPPEGRSPLVPVLLGVVLLAALAWIAWSMHWFGLGVSAPAPVPAPARPSPTAPRTAATNAPAPAAPAVVPAKPAPTSMVEHAVAATVTTNVDPAVAMALAAEATNAALASAGAASTNAPAKTEPAGPPRWPAFSVKGVILVPGQAGLAMIDDQALDQGRTTRAGLKIVDVQEDRVSLEFNGERRTYAVGTGEQ